LVDLGGDVIVPLVGLLGFVAGYKTFQTMAKQKFAVGFFAAAFAALLIWYLGGYLSAPLSNFIALEAVPSRDMGGFMLNIILGTVCVSISVPLGILLALGRQSDLPVIRVICVVFIEFIRGVPLITLLFVANVVLAYFLPPGTNFDLILRVIIMITLFSAAYIAEVIRGGLAALPAGQYEAAGSLGLRLCAVDASYYSSASFKDLYSWDCKCCRGAVQRHHIGLDYFDVRFGRNDPWPYPCFHRVEWDLLGVAWLRGYTVFHRLLWYLAIFTMARATARNRSPLKGSFYDTTCKIDRLGRSRDRHSEHE